MIHTVKGLGIGDKAEIDFFFTTEPSGKPQHIHVTKFLKRWESKTVLPVSCENCMQVKKQHLEPDMG